MSPKKEERLQLNTMNPTELAQFLAYTIPAREPILITGKPGIGKSDIVVQAANACGADIIFIHAVVSDPTDAKGMPWVRITKDGDAEAVFIPFYELQKMINAQKLTLVFLDDFGQAPPSVQAAFMQLLLARRINEHKISDYVVFVGATNRRQDKAAVSGVLEPVKSRFTAIIELITNIHSWLDWSLGDGKIVVKKSHINERIPILPVAMEVVQFMRKNSEWIDKFEATNDLRNTPTPRTIVNMSKFVKMGLPKELQLAAFSGAAGQEIATAFHGFLKFYTKMPDPDVVIANPTKAPVPDTKDPDAGISIMYALVGSLAQRANVKNFDNIAKYADRIPKEFQVYLMKDSTRLNGEIRDCKGFTNWALKNASVIV
ncbi:MAG: ATP-binding protein [Candidatus Heimdallarchaeaceae archaeon]|jgi:hypothetical protein